MGLFPVISACQSHVTRPAEKSQLRAQRKRFDGIPLRLIVDAVPGAAMEGVEFFVDEHARPIHHSVGQSQRNKSYSDFPDLIPLEVRVTWRKDRARGPQMSWGIAAYYDDFGRRLGGRGDYIPTYNDDAKEIAKRQLVARNTGFVHHGPWGSDYSGELQGDYIVKVAERIPDEVLQDIRRQRGNLRLKFRLKPDGVMFGWDIERDGGGISRFDMAGGDFKEARYVNKRQDPGWELQPDGSRKATDY